MDRHEAKEECNESLVQSVGRHEAKEECALLSYYIQYPRVKFKGYTGLPYIPLILMSAMSYLPGPSPDKYFRRCRA